MEQMTRPEADHTLRGTLLAMESLDPQSGVLALTLRQADGSKIEVLLDSESMLQYLTAIFGSADAAAGQKVALSGDVFGFADLGGTG